MLIGDIMYCIITIQCKWYSTERVVMQQCRDKSNETLNFCCFRCAATSPITVYYKLSFLHLFLLFFVHLYAKIRYLQHHISYQGRVTVHFILL